MRALAIALLLLASSASAATVEQVIDSVRAGVRSRVADSKLASQVRAMSLTERLDSAVVEEMQTEGAGRETVDALELLRGKGEALPSASLAPLFEAPPVPDAAQRAEIIAAARKAALQYTERMPNFLCTETIRRFNDAKNKWDWKAEDTLSVATSYNDKADRYKLLAVNGKPTNKPLDKVGGFKSNGEFGARLRVVFEAKSKADFQWARWSRLRGRMAAVFSYRVLPENSSYTISRGGPFGASTVKTGHRGHVWIDQDTHQILRMTSEADGIPPTFVVKVATSTLDYEYATVAGERYLLPQRVESRVVLTKGQRRNVTEFGDYRRFSSEATLSFEPEQ